MYNVFLIRSAAFVAAEIYLHVYVRRSGSDEENATWHCNVCVLYTILVNYNIRLNWFLLIYLSFGAGLLREVYRLSH